MKKTVSANISGMIFQIEEEAYHTLATYLESLRRKLEPQESGEEIYQDIEARIAEILQERLSESKQVITDLDVEHVMERIGAPEYMDDQDTEEPRPHTEPTTQSVKKRLYRDPDNEMIGGVCSGLAAYLDIDTIVVRAVFLALVFIGGSGVPLYIILWILLPAAKTTSEKLQMRGQSPTYENIKSHVTEEMQRGGRRIKEFGEEAGGKAKKAANKLGPIIGGFIILMTLLCSITPLVVFLVHGEHLFNNPVIEGAGILDMADAYFQTPALMWMMFTGIFLLWVCPTIFFLFLGFKLLTRSERSLKWIFLSLSVLFIMGIVFTSVSGTKNGYYHITDESWFKREMMELDSTNVLMITTSEESKDGRIRSNNHSLRTLTLEDEYIVVHNPDVTVLPGSDSVVVIEVEGSSTGQNRSDAETKASHILFHHRMEGNRLILDPFYKYPKEDKLRFQNLDITVYVPVGTQVEFDHKLGSMLDATADRLDTDEEDLLGRVWTMHPYGLECRKCLPMNQFHRYSVEGERRRGHRHGDWEEELERHIEDRIEDRIEDNVEIRIH